MIRSNTFHVALVLGALTLSGCAGIARPEQAGFISDYSKLEKVDDNTVFYSAGKFDQYSGFIIEEVELLIATEEMSTPFTDEELAELQVYFTERLRSALTEDDGYEVVNEPGPGVARIRFALTNVKQTIGILNIALVTKITGAGIGGASAEGEIIDSVTGEQLAAIVRWGGGSRVLRAGITKSGDAKLAINRWCRGIRKMLDEAHGR